MFVRWKRRLKKPKTVATHPHLTEHVRYAVLVRSERVDGQPRQRIVRYLAHIGETYLDAPAHQQSFWRRVDWHLDDLALDPEVRQRIEAALGVTVPRPPTEPDAYRAAERAAERAVLERRRTLT